MALATAIVAGSVAVAATAVGGAIQSGAEHKNMRRARGEKGRAAAKVESLQNSRQTITNPYGGVTSLANLASDLSGQMSNPYASLGVATQAAEIQMEQSDIALANTLDTLRLQSIAISEGQREQQAEAAGNIFQFNAQEDRTNADISYNIAKETGAAQREAQARSNRSAATAGIFSGIGSIAGSVAGAAMGGPTMSGSDRRIKKNIKLIGKSKSGLNIYAFEYIDKIFGEGVWQGVMSDEVSSEAVVKNFAGEFDGVDYSKVDVEFKKIN